MRTKFMTMLELDAPPTSDPCAIDLQRKMEAFDRPMPTSNVIYQPTVAALFDVGPTSKVFYSNVG